jgi:ubiquinone biosynthesis protein
MVSHDADSAVEVLLDWGDGSEAGGDADIERLKGEIDAFIDHYSGVPLKQLDLAAMLSDLITILREHGLVLPPDLTLMIKAFITLEGMGRQLDPNFDMAESTAPYLERVLLTHYAPDALFRRGGRALNNALNLITSLPQDLRQLLRTARRGKLQVQVEVLPLRQFGQQVDRAASRLALAIVTAALIVGSAIVMNVKGEPSLPGLPSLGTLGFIAAVIGGIWLLISIWRSGKKE